MLAVGRALMSGPKLLMLDEPSLGLAPLIVKEIFRIISQLRAAGVSILLVEQNARAALQVADYGYVLETGDCVIEGPSAELAATARAIAELPAKLKDVLILCTVEGLSQQEAAMTLGISVKAVETRLSRARQKLVGILRGGPDARV